MTPAAKTSLFQNERRENESFSIEKGTTSPPKSDDQTMQKFGCGRIDARRWRIDARRWFGCGRIDARRWLRWAAAGACYATAWAYIPVRSPSCGALVTTRSAGMAGQAPPRFARDLLPGPSSCGRSRQSVRLDAAERADADGRDTPPAGDRKPAGPGVSAREKAAVASKPTGTKSTGTDPKMMKLARYVYAAAFLAPPDVED